METPISYLTKVHGDLLHAATRERRGTSSGGPRRRMPSGLIGAAAAIIVLAGLVGLVATNGGLGGSDDAGSASRAVTGRAATGATGGVAVDEGGGDQAGPEPAPADDLGYLDATTRGELGAVGQGRSELSRVIRTAEMSVVIARDSFDERFGDAVDVAEDHEGFVADSSSRERAGTIVVRVPADAFDETLSALRDLGEVRVESVHGEDVTAEYVDLAARLRIARSRLDVLFDLMDETNSIEQSLRVQNAMDATQLKIEQIQGQLRLLDDQTSLATIRLDLREEGVAADPEPPSIPTAFELAIDGFLGTISVIVIGLGYLLPLILIGLVGWFVVVRVRRRRAA